MKISKNYSQMAYIWSRYILVHSLQTGTEIWNVLGFVEGGKLEKPGAEKP